MSPRAGEPFDFSRTLLGLRPDGHFDFLANEPGPPKRIDGFTVGAPRLTRDAPHAGERHPDGDELVFLISGHVKVHLEQPDGDLIVELHAGEAVIVPRGIWHRIVLQQPSQLLHITPGPGGEHRPLPK